MGERRSTPGVSKNLRRSGEGMSEKGEGVGIPVASPPPPTAYFGTLSQFSSRSRAFGKGKETAATQATIYKVSLFD